MKHIFLRELLERVVSVKVSRLLLLIVFAFISMRAIGASTLRTSSLAFVSTAYFELMILEYKFPLEQRGRGGALALVGSDLILGKSDCTFVKVDTNTWQYEENYLPPLLTGEEYLPKSSRYGIKEMLPRVEDLIYHNGVFYVSYTRYDPLTDFVYFVISKLSNTGVWEDIYQSIGLDAPYYTVGSGGRMVIVDEKLFFSVGDFSLDRINGLKSDVAPQNPNFPWGKVNYLDLNNNSYHLYTLGHRNPQGMMLMEGGDILLSEHGPQGGDELNLLKRGGNYGWPYESFGTKYGSYREYKEDLPKPQSTDFKLPLYSFIPSPAITQMVLANDFDPKWRGDFLLGSLKAKTLYRGRIQDGRIIYIEPIYIDYRIRDIKQYGTNLYVLTDQGSILQITKVK